jgi:hypothetical protein
MNGHRHVFKIGPGKIFDVTATLHGVRHGDRLALESYFRKHRHHPRSPKRWHVLGSWRLHAGEHHFAGRTYGSYPGLFTLRVQFLRHGHLLRGSQSNRFYVEVRRFHAKKLRKPKHHKPHRKPHGNNGLLHGLAIPQHATTDGVLGDWDSVECASLSAGLGGGGVDVVPPFRHLGNDEPVNAVQVSFYSNYSNGSWGPWQEGNVLPQTVNTDGAGLTDITINAASGDSSASDELGTIQPLDFYGQQGYHTIGWDLAIQNINTGQWGWLSTDIEIPGSYQQYDSNGNYEGQSSTCYTYHGAGFGGIRAK